MRTRQVFAHQLRIGDKVVSNKSTTEKEFAIVDTIMWVDSKHLDISLQPHASVEPPVYVKDLPELATFIIEDQRPI